METLSALINVEIFRPGSDDSRVWILQNRPLRVSFIPTIARREYTHVIWVQGKTNSYYPSFLFRLDTNIDKFKLNDQETTKHYIE